jgi:hypothetical protein
MPVLPKLLVCQVDMRGKGALHDSLGGTSRDLQIGYRSR